ncbi:MAG: VWA domain-containing protein [Bacteroidota bacterium]|nr:VWA domain-containing protein [Bacteroidota bacterium]
MRRYSKYFLVFFLAILLIPDAANAQDSKKTRILIVVDCSNSMWGQWNGVVKMDAAKRLINALVDSLKGVPNVDIALRSYGFHSSRNIQDCQDTELEVPFSENNEDEIKAILKKLRPNGTTPIAYSLMQAAGDFPNSNSKNVIILVTDGIEECKGDPCAVSQALQDKKVILKPFIIGIGLTQDLMQKFDCVGRYYNPATEGDFTEILNQVISQALNNTTVHVNLNNDAGKAVETNVNMTFYTAHNNLAAYNFFHTMNQGKPDTFTVDPLPRYNIQVNTIPPVVVQNVTLKPSQHNIIDIKAPQGTLQLNVTTKEYMRIQCLVRRAGTADVIHVQDFNTMQDYLTGTYDIEVLTLPRLHFKNVKIEQGQITRIDIPQPGKVEFDYNKNAIASLYILRNNKHEWVIDIDATGSIRKGLFLLQPGQYKIVYRDKNSPETESTIEKQFRISSGAYVNVALD